MWRKLLKSAALVAASHRRFGKVFDGTSAQVVACMINKWRAKIIWRELYNIRDPLGREDHPKICRENTVAIRTEIVSKFKRNILEDHSPRILLRKAFFAQSLFFFTFFLSLIHYARHSIHWNLVFKPTLYKFIVLGSLGLSSSTFWA